MKREMAGPSKGCVFYVANAGYLFPALVSAIQARQHLSADVADVFIFFMGEECRESEIARDICRAENIYFVKTGFEVAGRLPIHYARLLFDRFVPPEYRQVLYLDSDTQIIASLDPLMRARPGAGGILAVRDPIAILGHSNHLQDRDKGQYFRSIGIGETDQINYVNSGVLRIDRADWGEMAETCLALYREKPGKFQFHDQDILNLVARDRIEITSFRWNFPAFLLAHNISYMIQPTLIHFMSNPRPWFGLLPAFGARWLKPYLDLSKKYPAFSSFRPYPGFGPYLKYVFQQYVVTVRNKRFWDSDIAINAILETETAFDSPASACQIMPVSNQTAMLHCS